MESLPLLGKEGDAARFTAAGVGGLNPEPLMPSGAPGGTLCLADGTSLGTAALRMAPLPSCALPAQQGRSVLPAATLWIC